MVASHQSALSGAPVPDDTVDTANATESMTLVGNVGISPAACASTLSNWVFLTFDSSRALYWVMNAQVRCKGCSRANCVRLSASNVTSMHGRRDKLLQHCGVCLLLHPPGRVACCQEKEDARASSSAISAVDFMQPCVLPCCMQTETFFYDTGSNINVTDRGQELGYTMAHSLATVATHNGDDRYEPALGCHLLCFFITAIQPSACLTTPNGKADTGRHLFANVLHCCRPMGNFAEMVEIATNNV